MSPLFGAGCSIVCIVNKSTLIRKVQIIFLIPKKTGHLRPRYPQRFDNYCNTQKVELDQSPPGLNQQIIFHFLNIGKCLGEIAVSSLPSISFGYNNCRPLTSPYFSGSSAAPRSCRSSLFEVIWIPLSV